MQFDELSEELQEFICSIIKEKLSIAALDKKDVHFTRLGLNRGFNSAIHKMILPYGRSFAIKITDHEEDPIVSMLHNRELIFYEWLQSCKEEESFEPENVSNLLNFYGGTPCDTASGVLILTDLSSEVGPHPDYIRGFDIDVVFEIVRQIAGYQRFYLSSSVEVSKGDELKAYNLPFERSLPKLEENEWMNREMKDTLISWIRPDTLFKIHTEIPSNVEGVTPTLAHCDLWPGNLLFQRTEEKDHLLAVFDWQTFKIGNPLIYIATVIGENMNTEDRREFTDPILEFYVNEMKRGSNRYEKRFEMDLTKARLLLSSALRWPCIQLMVAVCLVPHDDVKEEGDKIGRLSKRLLELYRDSTS